MVRTFKLKPWVYAGLLALSPMSADAAGLGKLTVTSALGQPLRAEIELVAVQPDELDSLSARLASPAAFQEAKIERAGSLLGITFTVEQKKDGKPVLKLSTLQPINEPFLDMLIELNWAAGKLLREYAVLLDPPGYVEQQAVEPVVAPAVKPAAPAEATMPPAIETNPLPPETEAPVTKSEAAKPVKSTKIAKPAEVSPAPASGAPTASPAAEAKDYGPVKKGDTLSQIARQYRPEGLSLDQMLVALYQANKQAFAGNNMNRLKTGQILRIPEEQQIAAIGHDDAAHEVKTHTADWNAYRQKLAAAVAEAPKPAEEAPKQVAKGKITAAVEEKGAPPAPTSKDVLKVTKGEAPANAKEATALQNRIQTLEEEKTAKAKELNEAGARIAQLEKSVKDMQQLIELKNKNLAEMQKQAETKPAEAPAAAKPQATPAETPPPKPAEAIKPAAPEPKVVEEPKPTAPKPVAAKPAAPPPKERGLLDNPLLLGGGVAVLAGAAALIAFNRRRRKSLSSFEDSILTGGDLKANTVFGETAGGVVDTGDTSFLTDFSQAGLGTIDTNDVDPIAEAEVYMAYGRDAQAEEILKEAMAKDPNRHEVHLKLLEIYASRKNLLAFETLAGELYAALGGKPSHLWDKAAEMGRALDPNNPLYGASQGSAAPGPELAESTAAEITFAPPSLGLETPTIQDDTESEMAGADLDFEVETPLATGEGTPAEEADISALEFDLGAIGEETAEQPVADTTQKPDEILDFDFGEAISVEAPAPAESSEQASPTAELDLDLDALAETAEPELEISALPPVAEESENLDFGLDLPEPPSEPMVAATDVPAETVPEQAHQDMHLDFDFDLEGEEQAAGSGEIAPAALAGLDLSGINLEMEEPAPTIQPPMPEPGAEGELAEVATKLDLARAYVEMGDKDGAKEILDEVLKEGSDQQQADAKQILAAL